MTAECFGKLFCNLFKNKFALCCFVLYITCDISTQHTLTHKAMTITIKNYLGKFEISHPTCLANTKTIVTAQQVQQVLDSPVFLQMASQVFGNYKYTIEGDRFDGYYIRTNCGFIETNTHKTAKKAFTQFLRKNISWAEMINA